MAESFAGLLVVLVPDFSTAFQLEEELKFFSESENMPILHFPDWETLPFDNFSPHQDIVSQRITTLYRLPQTQRGILVVPVATLMHRLCPSSYISMNTLIMDKGDTVDLVEMRQKLEHSGYRFAHQVMEHGEFTVRGSIIDLFPMGSAKPYRIDLFDDEIDSIRMFDPETQRSNEQVETIRLLPAREFPLVDESITLFRTKWRAKFHGDPRNAPVYQDVSQGNQAPGLEYYIPLFFEQTATLFDYLPTECMIVRVGDIETASKGFWQQIQERYEQYGHDVTRPILTPEAMFLDTQELFKKNKQYPQVQLKREAVKPGAGRVNFDIKPMPEVNVEPQQEHSLIKLKNFLSTEQTRILFCAETSGRRVVLKELLAKQNIQPVDFNTWQEFITSEEEAGIVVAPLEKGSYFTTDKIALITESELFGRRVMQRRRRKAKIIDPDASIRNLAELNIGAPVVHIDCGVGRYLGLTKLNLGGQEGEFVTLEYADKAKLYVPVSSLHLISRYSGADIEHAPLNTLGSDRWQKAKRKAAEQVRDVAAELLDIYAKRQAKVGVAFPKPDEQYDSFSAKFPFEETPDQEQAILQVVKDLNSKQPMDRVICGDVGFGKTEVAMRAAFLAVQAGKQVAVLVPTTLLLSS